MHCQRVTCRKISIISTKMESLRWLREQPISPRVLAAVPRCEFHVERLPFDNRAARSFATKKGSSLKTILGNPVSRPHAGRRVSVGRDRKCLDLKLGKLPC